MIGSVIGWVAKSIFIWSWLLQMLTLAEYAGKVDSNHWLLHPYGFEARTQNPPGSSTHIVSICNLTYINKKLCQYSYENHNPLDFSHSSEFALSQMIGSVIGWVAKSICIWPWLLQMLTLAEYARKVDSNHWTFTSLRVWSPHPEPSRFIHASYEKSLISWYI